MAATYSSLVGLAVGGKYEIRRVLGAGGMGVVCEAVHLDLGKRVAVKLIDKTMKESELIVARFRREARAAGQINSEHIVDVFDVGADARVGLYMVMEHLSGEDLQGRLERDKKIDVKTGVMIAHQVARGLAKAHEAGVIHRDLKPANVYLTERDNGQMLVKLLDFGVSKLLLEAPGSARITGSGTPIGTPLYMSPEQAEGKDDVDGRADIWSLGAVMYEALAGTPPFADRGSYHGTIVGILTSRPKLLHDAAPWVPLELAKVVDAMLVHDRDARIPNAAAVTQRLLDAFPTVLPDGTGKHTAVIVSQGTAAVDGTGDTEVFTAASFAAASRRASNAPNTGPPAQLASASPSPSHRVSNAPSSEQDSTKTVPDATSSPGTPSSDATRTGTATPVGISESKSSGGPKTAPLPPDSFSGGQRGSSPSGVPLTPRASANPSSHPSSNPHPSSSAGGVAMPATPPVIEPLPVSELAPTTERDDKLAVRAERRRVVTLASIALAIVGVAVGGYLAGRRGVAPDTAATAPPPVTTSAPATQPTTQPAATQPSATQAAPASTSINDLPPAATSASAAPAPAQTTKPLRRRALPKKPAESGSATAPTPYDEPPPSTPSSPTE